MKIDFKAMEIASNRVETRKSIIMWNLIIGLGIGSVLIPAVFHILFGI